MVRPSTRAARLFWSLAGVVAVLIAAPAMPSFAETAATAAPKPVARANPEYPRKALRRGLEGSVLLEFSVDGSGNVVAPRVIEAKPRGVFEAAALEALAKWKYEALGAETSPIQVRLTFRNRW